MTTTQDAPQSSDIGNDTDVAVIGFSCRFPGASDPARFWTNLRDGVESIRRFEPDELIGLGVDPELVRHPSFVPAAPVLDQTDRFDDRYWGYSPREASLIDPQQRVFLEVATEAFEHAGHDPAGIDGLVGVYGGMGLSTYLLFHLATNPDLAPHEQTLAMLGNDKDFLCTRTAYHLGLTGPSVTVQSGCSTGLVAAHMACDGLLSHQCDVALVGGSTVMVPQRYGYLHAEGGTASADGHCRPFDADADGTLFGSGAGALVLRRLADAVDDGDTIYAVIRGSALNNDGSQKAGFTAPSIEGQSEVIVRALGVAGVDADSIDYVETHGTATRLGDPMEVAALTRAFRQTTDEVGFCALGSVKANIGHLDAAAGIAGLLKTVLALHHREIPPLVNFVTPNPQLELDGSPFYIAHRRQDWIGSSGPRRAGVSAFGFGGTNAHMVLEAAPSLPSADEPPTGRPRLVAVSARSPTALDDATGDMVRHLASTEQGFDDVAWTSQAGRVGHEYRRVAVGRSATGTAEAFGREGSDGAWTARTVDGPGRVAFLCTGLGDHYRHMGSDLLGEEPFRHTVEHCIGRLRSAVGLDLRPYLLPESDGPSTRPPVGTLDLTAMVGRGDPAESAITAVAQPATFVIGMALAAQLAHLGITPDALLGHSLGELVAATVAGVFDLDDALVVVAERARLIEEQPAGAMLSVALSADEVAEHLDADLSISLLNGPSLTVIGGPPTAVAAYAQRLEERGVANRPLSANHAFHSPMLASVVDPLEAVLNGVRLSPPSVPLISNRTGTWLNPAEAVSPRYWAEHVVTPVAFAAGLAELISGHDMTMLEVGPGNALTSLAVEAACGDPRTVQRAIPTLPTAHDRRKADDDMFVAAIGRAWATGVDVDWDRLDGRDRRRRVPLPTYPFERRRCWVEPSSEPTRPDVSAAVEPSAEWLHELGWRSHPSGAHSVPSGTWVLIEDEMGVIENLAKRLTYSDADVVRLSPGTDPASVLSPDRSIGERIVVVYGPSLAGPAPDDALGFGMLRAIIDLALDVSMAEPSVHVDLWLLASGAVRVGDSDEIDPVVSALRAGVLCLPQEVEGIVPYLLDVERDADVDDLAAGILNAVGARRSVDRLLALRDGSLWSTEWRRADVESDIEQRRTLVPGGRYVIVGGLGRVGLDIANYLADNLKADVVLTTRDGDRANAAAQTTEYQRLAATAESVAVVEVDPADGTDLTGVLRRVESQHGPIAGVFHAAGGAGVDVFAQLDDLSPPAFALAAGPKLFGCRALDHAVDNLDHRPDFVCLISSNAAILGGVGMTGYTAGHLMLDAWAQGQRSTRWLSVNVEEWLSDDGESQMRSSFSQYGVTPVEAMTSIERILDERRLSSAAIFTDDLASRLDRWVHRPWDHRTSDRRQADAQRSPRPELDTPFVEPADTLERRVADVWTDLLWVDQIGRDDDFFALGGHSLLATQIVVRLRAELGTDLDLLSLFGTPTVAAVSARIRETTSGASEEERSRPRPRTRTGPVPLSYAQRRFWFLDRLAPGNPFYNVADVVNLRGVLNLEALQQAIDAIVGRHEALRTTFDERDGEPVQTLLDEQSVPITKIDLGNLGDRDRSSGVAELAAAEQSKPFDLAEGPLLRVTVVRTGVEEWSLFVTMHHIVSDAWSVGVFITELAQLYRAFARGRTSPLQPLDVQYADFAAWQSERLSGDRLNQLRSHWREALEGAPPLTTLPTDRERPTVQTFVGDSIGFDLDRQLLAGLHRISADNGCTLFMTMLAAFGTVLAQSTAVDDVVIGSPIAGRTTAEIEPLIGTFVNMVPLRVQIGETASFDRLLADVKATTLGAYANQDLPFELLVETIKPDRDLSHNPVFQVALVLQNAPLPDLTLGDLDIELTSPASKSSIFDLMLMLRETEDGAIGKIEYSTDLYDRTTIERLADRYRLVLEAVAAEPNRSLSDLPTMSDDQRTTLLDSWSRGGERPLSDESLTDRLTRVAAEYPDRSAVMGTDGETLSFAQLDELATKLAVVLIDRGVRPGSLVGLNVRRSPQVVALVIAVLRAGAAYVPIDPGYPTVRQTFIIDDARPAIVVTGPDGAPPGRSQPDGSGVGGDGSICVELAQLLDEAERVPSTPIGVTVDADDAAYVIYTSGSTGEPKGVVGLHGGMVNRLAWMWQAYPFNDGEVACQKTSLSFLDSFWEIFGPLCCGVPLVVFDDDVVSDPRRFVDALAQHEVSRIVVVPSLLQAMLDNAPDEVASLHQLRVCVTSGEALRSEVAARFLRARPGCRLLNLYGSSELSADVTVAEITTAEVERSDLPLGRPIDNTVCLVLDDRMQLVGPGVTGELYVGGVGLARGYGDRPGLTAERFVPDPYSNPGGRLYRTGDLARFDEQGQLQYAGRSDHQVKVRGFRVELGEVENALRTHPGLADVAVHAGPDRLVAYGVIAEDGMGVDDVVRSEDLRAHTANLLPDFMVPSAYVFLEQLPRTPSGKLDRRSLPTLGTVEAGQTVDGQPRSAVDTAVAELWRSALDLEQVGIHDDFFVVGGHSLLAAGLVTQLREILGVELPLKELFMDPTVAGISDRLEAAANRVDELWERAELFIEVTALSDDEVEAELDSPASADERLGMGQR